MTVIVCERGGLFSQLTTHSKWLLIIKCTFKGTSCSICNPIEVRWFPKSGSFILLCQHNGGPIFLFSEVEGGGSAVFANVIPNRSYTNAIRAAFGSVVHKIDWQQECGISVAHSAILRATAACGGERGEVCAYCEGEDLSSELWVIMLQNNLRGPGGIRFTELVGPNQKTQLLLSSHWKKSQNWEANIRRWGLRCAECVKAHTFLLTHAPAWTECGAGLELARLH